MIVILDIPNYKSLSFDVCDLQPLADLELQVQRRLSGVLPLANTYLTGRHGISASEVLSHSTLPWLSLRHRILGGKGGFGSTLRAQGSRTKDNKPANYDNCRDLYGRRLKTLKDAKTIVEKVELDEKARVEAKERRRKKIAEGLAERPVKKYRFNDVEYEKESEELREAAKMAANRAAKREKEKKDREAETDKDGGDGGMMVPLFDGELDELSSSSSSSSESDNDEVGGDGHSSD
ncbi:hypothetical protein GGI15_004700 [Coemansia interrupta]|uniref:SDE2-like domain-containing protein n=1 Tax=Coemansia interrupta TaxID=1126814 RepID=A0A9W8H2H8_9FUNG|nr:hypothetical protein GGI15_004700 [Coemansia interrupta]